MPGDTQTLRALRPDGWSADLVRKILVLALGYWGTGALGLLLAIPPGYATAVWPPSGIALAGLLVWGPRVWPGIFIGSFLVNAWVSFTATPSDITFTSFAVAASIGVGSTLQAVLAAWLIRKSVGVANLFVAASTTLAFAAIVAICCIVAATWGVATLSLAGVLELSSIGESWQTWWLGDLTGVLIILPALLTWKQFVPNDSTPAYVVETFGALALLAVVTGFVFYYQPPFGQAPYPLTFLPLPCLAWIACRTNAGGVALGTCLVSAIAIVATSSGSGPLVRDSANDSLLLLQTFTGISTLMALTLASAVTGHKAATATLRNLSRELRELALTDELTGVRNRRGFLLLADQTWRLAKRARVRCLLIFIDLDGLKEVNDTQGHQAGDALLVDAAGVLNRVFRESDVIGRVGGDEFAVLELVDGSDNSNAGAERLRLHVEEFNRQAERPYRLAMSCGVEELAPTADATLEELLARADRAMYERKRVQRLRR